MLRTLLVVAIMVPGVLAALGSRFAALLLYLWFALFRPQEWVWVDISHLRLSLVLGLILIVPSIATGVFPNVSHPVTFGALLLVLASLVAQVGAVDPQIGWMWIDYFVRLVLVCMLAVTLITTPKRFAAVLAVIALSFGFHGAKAGLASMLWGGVKFYDGLAGSFVDSNGYALGCVMVMPMLIAVGQNQRILLGSAKERRWVTALFYGAAGLTSFAVVSLFSRGGFLALAVAIAAFTMLQRRRLLAFAAVGGLLVAASQVVPLPQGYLDRIETIRSYDEIEETSALSRLHFWNVAVQMAFDRPFGVGLHNFVAAYDRYDTSEGRFGEARSAHSSHFEVLAETGFFGAAVYLGLFAYAFAAAFRVRARSRDDRLPPELRRLFFTGSNALLISMASFLTGGAFVSMALNDLTWLTFALVAALDRLSHQFCAVGSPAPGAAHAAPHIARMGGIIPARSS